MAKIEFVYGKKEIEQTFKVGDIVFMNDKYKVPERYQGRVWVVKSDVQDICGTPCVFLQNYKGAYAMDGLTKATDRQRMIYILQNLDDECFEKMIVEINQALANIGEHNNRLYDDEERSRLYPDEILEWYANWDKKRKVLEFEGNLQLKHFYELLNGMREYLYNERVKRLEENPLFRDYTASPLKGADE